MVWSSDFGKVWMLLRAIRSRRVMHARLASRMSVLSPFRNERQEPAGIGPCAAAQIRWCSGFQLTVCGTFRTSETLRYR